MTTTTSTAAPITAEVHTAARHTADDAALALQAHAVAAAVAVRTTAHDMALDMMARANDSHSRSA